MTLVPEVLPVRTVEELRELASSGELLAGGTDMMVQIQQGRRVKRLIDLSGLLDGPPVVVSAPDRVRISAVAPLARVARALGGRLPGLDASISVFGSVRIRNRATVGGNLGNASPAGDTIPPLVAADAIAILRSRECDRVLPVVDLITGPRRTALRPGEWIETLEIPLPAGREGFRKIGTREADAVTIVSLAWRWQLTADSRLHNVAIALGAVAPTVVRATRAETELEGQTVNGGVIERALSAIQADVSPIDDYRASAAYRRELVRVLLYEELSNHAQHAI